MKLPGRHSRLVFLAVCGLTLVLGARFVVVPFIRYERSLDGRLRAAARQLDDVRVLERRLIQLRETREKADAEVGELGDGFTLFSHLEGMADRLKLRGAIESMRPASSRREDGYVEQTVDLRLRGVTLEKLARFLYSVEFSKIPVSVRSLQIRNGKENLDVDLVCGVLIRE